MAEAEVVVNSRPLTVETISNVTRPLPLFSSNLLTVKSNIVMPHLEDSNPQICILESGGDGCNTL